MRLLRSPGIPALAVALGGTALAVAAGIVGLWWVTLGGVVVAALAELWADGPAPLESILQRSGLDRLPRAVLRMLGVLAAGFHVWTSEGMLPAFGWTAAGVLALDAATVALLIYVEHARTPIVLTRNVELDVTDPRPAPPPGVTARTAPVLGLLELSVSVPALLAPGTPALTWALGGAAVAVLLVVVCWLVLAARAVGGSLRGAAMRRRAQEYLDRTEPEVLVYFGGRRDSAYQLTMWLETLERLPERTLLLLRDPKVLATLPPTSLRALCVPGSVDLMALDLGCAHVALFAANVGNSLHVLRLPHLMTVFIGHGDSDKSASSSPFAKAYDEVWVAGPAGRERYRRAQVGVHDDDIVEVGRPQLDVLLASAASDGEGRAVPTLLYAPTWEGWNAEQHYTSLDSLGPEIVAAALAHPDPVRVVYKPHPFTGRRDPRIARAHGRIVAMLEAANAGTTGERATSALQLPGVAAVETYGPGGAFSRSATSAVAAAEARSVAEADFWARRNSSSHVVVPPDGPSLFSCFVQADGLVTDVSSVLSDFTATGKPYAVTNPTGVPVEQFTRMFPAAGAGFVIGPKGGPAELLSVMSGAAPDEHVADRRAQREHLLGSSSRPATERFAQAVAVLAARGRAREAAHLERGVLKAGDFSAGDDAGDD